MNLLNDKIPGENKSIYKLCSQLMIKFPTENVSNEFKNLQK